MSQRIRALVEGDHDRAVLNALQAAGLLPENLEIGKKPDRATIAGGEPEDGTGRLLFDAARFAAIAGTLTVVVRDNDKLSPEGLKKWLHAGLKKQHNMPAVEELADKSPNLMFAVEHGGHVALIGAGLNQDSDLRNRFGLDSFTMDDYVLRLAVRQEIYEQVAQLREFPYEHGMRKLDEVRELFKRNGITLTESKRYLQILRAIAGFAVSPTVFNDRVASAAYEVLGLDQTRNAFQPFLGELHAAVEALLA